jgi:hypothetical protein
VHHLTVLERQKVCSFLTFYAKPDVLIWDENAKTNVSIDV